MLAVSWDSKSRQETIKSVTMFGHAMLSQRKSLERACVHFVVEFMHWEFIPLFLVEGDENRKMTSNQSRDKQGINSVCEARSGVMQVSGISRSTR